jgi:hypothetical protein
MGLSRNYSGHVGKSPNIYHHSIIMKMHELGEQIGHGAYGMACKGKYNNEAAVIKKILGASAKRINCFVKEARLIFSLNHENIATFKGFSSFHQKLHLNYPKDWNYDEQEGP